MAVQRRIAVGATIATRDQAVVGADDLQHLLAPACPHDADVGPGIIAPARKYRHPAAFLNTYRQSSWYFTAYPSPSPLTAPRKRQRPSSVSESNPYAIAQNKAVVNRPVPA